MLDSFETLDEPWPEIEDPPPEPVDVFDDFEEGAATSVTSELADIKKQARAAAAKRRAAAHETHNGTAGAVLAERGLPLMLTPATVSGFVPYKSEIDTRPLLGALQVQGWRTCLPVVIAANAPLVFRVWAPGGKLVPGVWDIPVPGESAPEVLPDVLLVPMLAFDRAGYRLGYGGGFYDRTLEKLRALKKIVAIGVAYAAQMVDEVPRGPYDAPLDFIMTETETFTCA